MKKLFTLLLVAIVVNNVYSQNYDLIVKTNGDSIACHIDSINDSQIYFEMKVQNHWIHTNIDRNEVVDYKYTAIDKKTNVFKPGTSFIESSGKEPTSLRDIQRNSIAFETNIANYSLYYGRLFPLGNIAGITVGAAYNYFVFDKFSAYFFY